MGITVEFGVTSCGQFSPTATYAQAKDVDNHGVPVEQTRAQRCPRSGELDSNLASDASVGPPYLFEPCLRLSVVVCSARTFHAPGVGV